MPRPSSTPERTSQPRSNGKTGRRTQPRPEADDLAAAEVAEDPSGRRPAAAPPKTSPAPVSPAGSGRLHSVGRVSKETGISPGTLRMWERRYGTPVPMRLESGHRRYTEQQVCHLRRVAEAMALGHRPGALLALTEPALGALLEQAAGAVATSGEVQAWLELVRGLRESELGAALRAASDELDLCGFLEERVAPLLLVIGREWADGRLGVRHGQFAAHVVGDFLRALRTSLRARPGRSARGAMLLATLPGELHGLGLEMVGVLCESMRVRTWLVGVDMPIAEIAQCAAEVDANVVGVSVSLASGGVRTDAVLCELAGRLPVGCTLLVGGVGARGNRRKQAGVDYCETLGSLRTWLAGRFGETPGG